MTLLRAESLHLAYRTRTDAIHAINDVTVRLHGGQLTVMSGPSGSGKSSLLLLLSCFLRPDSGEVFVNGAAVSVLSEPARMQLRSQQIGFVSQEVRLFRSLTVLQNVVSGLETQVVGQRASALALEALSRVGLEAKAYLRPVDLKGGEERLVTIARALVRNPPILLADDTAGSLNPKSDQQIFEVLASLGNRDKLVVLASRDPVGVWPGSRHIQIDRGQIKSDKYFA